MEISKVSDSILGFFKKINLKNNYLKVFLLAVATSAIMFLPFLIADKGLFLFYGDYNVQQIPFYKLAHEAIRSGEFWWNFNTDLGVNFIGSYSFYLLGSPFFWLTIPFPTSFVPYLMAPLFILKFGVAAVTAYGYISRFTKTKEYALIGAILYAFSGFSVYNIFFNHFNDVIALFPLLLIALEEFIVNRRRGIFVITVALMATVNYFFFAGQVIFIFIYFFVRSTCSDFKYTIKQFLVLAFESLLGVVLAAAILLPSYLAICNNPRTSETLLGFNLLAYDNVQRYMLILQSMFFPPDIPARPNFFPDSNAKWSSVSAFLPLFGMSGVIAFFKDKKKHFIKLILIICAVMAFIPVLNSSFYMFNSSYYARWFYMPILFMALATVKTFENKQSNIMFGLKWSAIIVAIFSVIGILPEMVEGELEWFTLPPYPSRFWLSVLTAVVGLLAVFVLVKFFRKHKDFTKILTASVCVVSLLFSITFIATGKTHSYTYKQVVDMGLNAEFDLPDSKTGMYRIDVYEGMDNYPMFWGMPTIQAFHSIVPASTMTFYESIGVERGVASRPDASFFGLRGLTSVKYLFYSTNQEDPEIPGFTYYDTQNNFVILENEAYVPMGYTYDKYISKVQFDNSDTGYRDVLLTGAMMLTEEQIKKYGQYMLPASDSDIDYLDENIYLKNCETNASNAVSSFKETKDGFKCKITMKKENLVYLSVPYDEGFTAYVNGKKTKIENVNNGFCAVVAPAGENTIKFVYRTPGLKLGLKVSLVAFGIYILYLAVIIFLTIKNRKKYGPLPKQHKLYNTKVTSIIAGTTYIETMCKRYDNNDSKKPSNPSNDQAVERTENEFTTAENTALNSSEFDYEENTEQTSNANDLTDENS